MILKLRCPVKVGEGPEVSQLDFRERVIARDWMGLKVAALTDMLNDDLLKVAGRLCAQPDAIMQKLEFVDYLEVIKAVGGFLGAGLETGTTA